MNHKRIFRDEQKFLRKIEKDLKHFNMEPNERKAVLEELKERKQNG